MATAVMDTTGRPDERELLAEVSRHPDGIDALTLVQIFSQRGYEPYNIQRTMQRALDKGALELGSKLRLCVALVAA
ncbi:MULTISPECIES: hypothetical protein [unclassified Bradyrhizobium]|uniref:hypothetical protein n=1 Tax=unclassified Bradyrhizobium TaxID=2631580 RepID=UPI001FFB7F7C|nr:MULTISPECIES: hypothetical protein [unclassified Bradyrhizobium]MCK1305708.1 hypothetical protein [Bradyrhizobium sp. 45]MCK1440319.1 hypothetical protein [Bradyrhizobium sp. 15]MCK1612032.1 hypothetical protein [Bradyrhizobium sp. 163]MCK1761163.1 hypothetical protein [Bradyrhizobium sp. 136]